MEKVAALFFPALPLQIVVHTEPAIKNRALAIVEDHRVKFVNKKARALGLRPGMADHQALRLVSGLQVRNQDSILVAQHLTHFSHILSRYSPAVEPHPERLGLFLLDAGGLAGLWRDESEWARELLSELESDGWSAKMVLGHRRLTVAFLVLATRRRLELYESFSMEARAFRNLPLSLFALPDQGFFTDLGLSRLADLLSLPRSQIAMRCSDASINLVIQSDRALEGDGASYVDASREAADPQMDLDIEEVLLTADSLLFLVKRALHQVLADLENQRKAITGMALILEASRGQNSGPLVLEVRPASPTRDISLLLDLLRLKFETIRLDAAPSGIRLVLHTDHRESRQLRLFAGRNLEDIDRADKELARLRAQLPHGALVTSRIKPAHMPEHRAEWTAFDRIPRPDPARRAWPTLIRRKLDAPRVLARRPEGRMRGPFLVSGGWWSGKTLRRKYFYVEQSDGRILWISYDPDTDRFLLWGDVE